MNSILQQLQQEIGESLAGLDATQTQLRPAGDAARWSIQQIVEHLTLSYGSTARVFETRIAKGSPTRALPSLQQRVAQIFLLRFGYFPPGRKAPAAVMPSVDCTACTGGMLAARTEELLWLFDELAAEAERLFGMQRAISHGVLGPICVADWRRFHLLHGEHHLKQIRAIRAEYRV